ncbi:MAG: sugar phosphate isomerase/epimerase family protein [Pirellulaceae bacterium]
MDQWPIGVFTSINAGEGVQLDVAHELGVPTIQLHAPSRESRTPQAAHDFINRLDGLGIRLTAVFGGFEGESYADIPAVERTVGLVPAETRDQRLGEMMEISDFATHLGCDVVALHLGFVPHDTANADYTAIVETTRFLCNHCRSNGQHLHLETGQETADALIQFMDDVECDNLFVNFDPANMIMYGTGEPIEALKKIGARVRSVHCKDACWADQPGQTWGRETPLGEGDVGIRQYLETLRDLGYSGPLTIEREIAQEPERQKAEIGQAIDVLNGIKSDLGYASI